MARCCCRFHGFSSWPVAETYSKAAWRTYLEESRRRPQEKGGLDRGPSSSTPVACGPGVQILRFRSGNSAWRYTAEFRRLCLPFWVVPPSVFPCKRSEERRVGKEWCCTFGSGWSREH